MGRTLLKFGQMLMVSRRNRSVRQSIILLFTNILLFSGVVFTLEIILIFLGIGNIFLPLTTKALSILNGIFY
jgi:hypothetical protein